MKLKRVQNYSNRQALVKICFIGNIYCNEILYLSRINPSRGIKNITKKETNKILFLIKKFLKNL